MKNTMKIMLALLTSVSLVGSVNAGEISVSGSAKATYNMLSGGTLGASRGSGRALGITNEIDFGATGELDNGYTWNYQVQMDPGATTTAGGGGLDDTRLELTTGYGTLGIYVSEGGLDTDNSASQSVYAFPTDLIASGIVDGPGIGSFNNIQLHTPAGLLPYGIAIKGAFAPGAQSGITSGNAAGVANADTDVLGNVEQIQIKANPVDGLNLGADYIRHTNQGNATAKVTQREEAGSIFATYAYGPASVGLSTTRVAPLILGTATGTVQSNTAAAARNANAVRTVENKKMSVAYNVNENLSVSYEVEKSNRELIVNAVENDIKSQAIQAAYTMGGMTLSISRGNTDNVGYVATNEVQQTLFAMSMVF